MNGNDGDKPKKRRAKAQIVVAVSPQTRRRLAGLQRDIMERYHEGRGGIPSGVIDHRWGLTMDRLIAHLIDLYDDHRARSARSNARRSGARAKPAPEPESSAE